MSEYESPLFFQNFHGAVFSGFGIEMVSSKFFESQGGNTELLRKRRTLERQVARLDRLRSDGEELETWGELLAEGEEDPELGRFLDRL